MTDPKSEEAQRSGDAPALQLIPLLAHAVAAASERLDREEVIETFLDEVTAGGIAAAAVHLLDPDRPELRLAGARDLPEDLRERLERLPLGGAGGPIHQVALRDSHPATVAGPADPLVGDVPDVTAALSLPLLARGRLEGVLTLWLRGAEHLTERSVELLRTAVDAFAGVLGNSQARQRAEREVRQMRSVDAAALEIAGPLEVRPVLQRIVEHARTLAHGSYAALGVLADGDPRGPFSAMVESGELPSPSSARPMGRPGVRWPQAVLGQLSGGGRALLLSQLPEEDAARAEGIRSLVAVSVRYGEQPLGYLYVANRVDAPEFDASDQRGLEMLAQHAAIAVAHAREHEQLVRAIREKEQSDHALLESERRFRRLAENVPDVIFRLGFIPQPHLEYVSRAIENILGHPAEAYLADLNLALRQLHPLDRPRVEDALERPEEFTQGLLLRFEHVEGRRVWAELRFAAVRDDLGELAAVEGIARDVSETKRAEAEIQSLLDRMQGRRAWLETVIDHSPVGIVLIEDPQGLRIRANREAQQLFGRPLDPTGGIDQFIHQLRDPQGRSIPYDQLVSVRALQGKQVSGEQILCERPDGRNVPVLVSGTPLTDARGQVEGAVLAYRDISALKELERLREEWTSVIAHDLRQPANAISMQAHLLVQDARDPKLRQRAEHILGSGRKLMRMVDDLMEFSRIESRNLEIRQQEFDLDPLAREVIERLQALDGHSLQLVTRGAPVKLWADPDRIEQVLSNLVTNAQKYGAEGTEIEILLETVPEGVHVAVTNRGEGIPASEVPDLFRKFHRSRAARRGSLPGLGLGLYISRGLIEAHGGRIWVESTVGERTIFHFVLPARREVAVPPRT